MDTQLSHPIGVELSLLLQDDPESFRSVGRNLLEISIRIGGFGLFDFNKPLGSDGLPHILPAEDIRLTTSTLKKLVALVPRKSTFTQWVEDLSFQKEIDTISMFKAWDAMTLVVEKKIPTNADIAKKLKEVAALRKLQGDQMSSRAHMKAASLVLRSKNQITSGDDAIKIKGIGPKIAVKIEEIIQTETLAILTQKSQTDIILENFTKMWGTSIAIARSWYDRGYRDIDDIRRAVDKDIITLTKLQKIGLQHYEDFITVMSRSEMEAIGEVVRACTDVTFHVTIVGSYRRGKDGSEDVDILVIGPKQSNTAFNIKKKLEEYDGCKIMIPSSGEHQIMGAIQLGALKCSSEGDSQPRWRRFDVFVAHESEMACRLLAHTGPANYNERMRDVAKKRGWMLNEKCLRNERGEIINVRTEAEVQRLLGFPIQEPQDRK